MGSYNMINMEKFDKSKAYSVDFYSEYFEHTEVWGILVYSDSVKDWVIKSWSNGDTDVKFEDHDCDDMFNFYCVSNGILIGSVIVQVFINQKGDLMKTKETLVNKNHHVAKSGMIVLTHLGRLNEIKGVDDVTKN